MKYGKRLLAVMMVLVMVLTIVPLTMFAFALDGNGTSAEPYQIKTYAELKALLEGLGGDGYPADAYYRLENDIDPLHDWVFASADNQKKAAEDLGMSPIVTPATYAGATEAERTNDTPIYSKEGDVYTLYEGARDADTIPDITLYWVRTSEETSTDAPLTEEQFAALTSAQRKTILQNNSDVIPSITPKNTEFYGTFDGNNKTIKGLQIHVNATQAAMFFSLDVKKDDDGNVLSTGTVKNLTVDDTSLIGLVSANTAVAVSAGTVASTNTGIIQNVTSNATINVMVKLPVLFVYAGGIAGRNDSAEKGAEITDCTFGGTLNFIVADATFSGTPNYASIDSTSISLGGIAGSSESAITGTFSGSVNTNFIGGTNEQLNENYAGDTVYAGDENHDITPPVTEADKKVGSKDADTYFGTQGTITKGEPNDDGYQLIKQTLDGKDTFYIRQIVCAHAAADVVSYPAKAATCTEDGNNAYWHCNACNKDFTADPTGNPTAAPADFNKDIKLSKTGHKYGDWQQEENNNTQHKRICEHDSSHVEYQNHKFKDVVTPATTEAQGYTTHTCTVCGYSFVDSYTPVLAPSVEPKSGSGYSKDSTGGYLITALPASKSGITIAQLTASLEPGTYTVRNAGGTAISSTGTIVRTGYTVEVTGNPDSKVIIAVRGDVNKDGKVSSLDYVKVKNHILKKADLSGDTAAFYAADANGDGKVSALDYVKIKNLILKG